MEPEETIIILLALVGLADSLYFTLVHYGVMAPDARWVPAFCRMEERSCQSVLESPYARVFAVPNSVPGMIYYLWMISASGISLAVGKFPLLLPSLILAWAVVLFSIYLTYALLFRLKILCPLCFLAHGVNLGIAMVLTGMVF